MRLPRWFVDDNSGKFSSKKIKNKKIPSSSFPLALGCCLWRVNTVSWLNHSRESTDLINFFPRPFATLINWYTHYVCLPHVWVLIKKVFFLQWVFLRYLFQGVRNGRHVYNKTRHVAEWKNSMLNGRHVVETKNFFFSIFTPLCTHSATLKIWLSTKNIWMQRVRIFILRVGWKKAIKYC